MKAFLPEHVHAVSIDADVVFLDAAADVYFCLVGVGELMVIGADGSVAASEPQAIASLIEAGLLADSGQAGRQALPPVPTRSVATTARAVTPGRLVKALSANARAAKAMSVLGFPELLAMARVQRAAPLDDDRSGRRQARMEAESARFARQAPWLPRDGDCLMRSLQQLLYLRALGHAPSWVFGVRTWPFQAHCWLQVGDVVLDDHVEHVRAFAPIMAI